MNELKEGIYSCSLCKGFICKEDEMVENHIPSQELDKLNYIALKKFENIRFNLDFTKTAYLSSDTPLFSYCALLDINCKRCKQKIGFIPLSTTASTTQLRDQVILTKDRILFNEVQVKSEISEKKTMADFEEEDSSTRVLSRSEHKKKQTQKSLFLMRLEENIDSLQDAVNKYQTKYKFMFGFYEDLLKRFEVVESQVERIQKLMFDVTAQAFERNYRLNKKVSIKPGFNENSNSNDKKLIMYKPPKKNSTIKSDVQKWLSFNKSESSNKLKRKRENNESDEKLYSQELGGIPYKKALKYDQ